MSLAPGQECLDWSRVLGVGVCASVPGPGTGWQWLWEQLGSAVTRCPCCHRNSQGCGLAAHTESSWQAKSKAGCWASHPRLVLAQCLWMCWGHQLHRGGCNSSSHRGTATCLVGDRLCCPAQVRAPLFLLSLKCLMTLANTIGAQELKSLGNTCT